MNKKEMILKLMQLDREFCEECVANGAIGWVKYFSEDAIMVSSGTNDNIVGKDEILRSMEKVFGLDNIDFTWTPHFGDISNDFTMGYTSGTYVRKYKLAGAFVEQKGKYTTFWKLIDDKYLITLDIGN
ncbi:MAG: nuclear transport factor 2 family protein [Firmicutes bacterium]|nr:nuclear transport factor 2 family protein [Bacillota bacterium]